MSWTLFWKVLRDLRWPLFLVGLLLTAYQMLWARITGRITELAPKVMGLFGSFDAMKAFESEILKGPGEIIRAMLGGELINLNDPQGLLTIGYVHPFMQTVFCIWAVGRASAAVAGEIDKGTMELLLAQPVARWKLILTHVAVDLVTIPALCLCLILGTWIGTLLVKLPNVQVDRFPGALLNAGALMFAVSGYTLALSAMGRFRWRVLSLALGVTLVQFLVNLLGQLWDVLAPFRPFTVFYYYQPQPIILRDSWTVPIGKGWPWLGSAETLPEVNVVVVLLLVGAVGYAVALWTFTRRDLPAPL